MMLGHMICYVYSFIDAPAVEYIIQVIDCILFCRVVRSIDKLRISFAMLHLSDTKGIKEH